jgi:hypothetical protein
MDVGRMTLWEFSQYVQGYAESKGAKPRGKSDISEDRLAEMGVVGFD